MLGAIIGDIVGSRFEFNNYRKKDFEFFHEDCYFTELWLWFAFFILALW